MSESSSLTEITPKEIIKKKRGIRNRDKYKHVYTFNI